MKKILLIFSLLVISLNSFSQATTCAGATVLTINGACGGAATISDATLEGINPSCGTPGPVNREGWYTFNNASVQNVSIAGVISSRNLAIQLLSGACGSQTELACENSNGNGLNETLIYSCLPIGTYYIKITNVTATPNNMALTSLCVTSSACVPSPDNPCSATVLTVGASCSFTASSNVGMTASPGVPAPGCASYAGGDIWFSVTVPASGNLIFDTNSGGVTDGGMAIYSGACGGLLLISCNDDGSSNGSGLMPKISQSGLTPGATIWIRFWEYGNNVFGSFSICVYDAGVLPTGASCADPTVIASIPFTHNGQTTCGFGNQYDSGDACASIYMDGEDHIYRYTPGSNQSVDLALTGTGNWTGLFVFDGCPDNLATNCVGSNTQSGGNPTINCLALSAGTTYYILISTFPAPNCTAYNLSITQSASLACTYTISTPAYVPDAAYTAGTLLTFPDDQMSAVLPLGFTFCFYGTNYTQLVVSSNSYVSFNTGTTGGFSDWSTVPIPLSTPAEARNSIMFPWQDVDPSIGVSSDIRYLSTGTAPNRKFIVNFSIVPMYLPACNALLYTGQVVLNETSNIIETYIQDKPVCATWNSGHAVHGLNGNDGCSATIVTGRNNTVWGSTGMNDAKMFTPSGCCVTPLAAELLSFEGEQISSTSNRLTWVTATESNLDKFIIEKSENGIDFENYHEMNAVGNSSVSNEYSITDNLPYDRITYYRLTEVDNDGGLKYSNSIAIINTNWSGFSVLNLYPNPSNGIVNSEIYSSEEMNFTLEVKDISGRILRSSSHTLTEGSNILNYDLTDLDGGIYLFHFVNQTNGKSSTHRFIKE